MAQRSRSKRCFVNFDVACHVGGSGSVGRFRLARWQATTEVKVIRCNKIKILKIHEIYV